MLVQYKRLLSRYGSQKVDNFENDHYNVIDTL
mgnify:CR=1 FL=1